MIHTYSSETRVVKSFIFLYLFTFPLLLAQTVHGLANTDTYSEKSIKNKFCRLLLILLFSPNDKYVVCYFNVAFIQHNTLYTSTGNDLRLHSLIYYLVFPISEIRI